MTFIYRWDGRYFGFIAKGCLFDAGGKYVGWVGADGLGWRADGAFLGEVVDESYLVRYTFATTPTEKPPRAGPPAPTVPPRPADRPPRPEGSGYTDALDQFP
jgi:hypothetical protein